MATLIIAAAVVLVLIYVGLTYNRLVTLRLAAANSWAQIDVALKLRHDLVPALADAVAGYAGHERGTFEEVARTRAGAVSAEAEGPGRRAPLESALAAGVKRVMILAEDYPDLKASENFAALQRQLGEVEEKIAITRRVYNDTVETYNTKTQVFPPVLVASAFGFEPREFFDAPAAAELAPEISIGTPPSEGSD